MPPSAPRRNAPRASSSRRSLSVLVAEGDEAARREAATALAEQVGVVHQAANGQEALNILRQKRPDMVVTDMVLPVVDGLDVVRRIRARHPDLPILVTFDGYNPSALLKVLEHNPTGFLMKPVDPVQLSRAVDRAARTVILRRKLSEARYTLQHILNLLPSPVLLVRQGRVAYANARLMRYLDLPAWEEFEAGGGGLDRFVTALDNQALDNPSPDGQAQESQPPEGQPPGNTSDDGASRRGQGSGPGWAQRIVADPLDREHVLTLANPRVPEARRQHFLVDFSPLPEPGAYLFLLSDVSEFEEEKQSLADEAATDPLTGALNRRKFLHLLGIEVDRAARFGHTFSLIMFDIDHFKSINDTYGHDAGDAVLRELSALVSQTLRDSDRLARWGGEEFLVLAADSCLDRAARAAERLRLAVEEHAFTGVPRPVTASFGVAEQRPDADAEALISLADARLYRAKEGGRNRVVSQ